MAGETRPNAVRPASAHQALHHVVDVDALGRRAPLVPPPEGPRTCPPCLLRRRLRRHGEPTPESGDALYLPEPSMIDLPKRALQRCTHGTDPDVGDPGPAVGGQLRRGLMSQRAEVVCGHCGKYGQPLVGQHRLSRQSLRVVAPCDVGRPR
jgi:hypothetical protein